MTPQELKNSILQLAIQGKLVEQRPEEGTAEELYKQIQAEKQALIKAGKIKKEKPLPEITEDEIPFEIPESWKWVRLGQFCADIFSGKSPVYSKTETNFRVVGQAANQQNGLDLSQLKYTNSAFWDSMEARYFLKENDVLLNTLGNGTLGRSGIIDYLPFPLLTDGHLFVFRTFDIISSKYLYCYLQYKRRDIEKAANGSTNQTFLSLSKTVNWLIPFPPLAEQKRIVAKIEELLPLIERYEKAWSRLEDFNKRFPVDMQKSILQMAIQGKLVEQRPEEGTGEELYRQIQAEKQALIKAGKIKKEKPLPEITEDEIPFEIPESWKWVRLVELGSFSSGKTPTMGEAKYWNNGTVQWFTSKDMKKKYLDESEMKITELAAEEMTKYPAGTLLMVVRSGILKRMLPLCILTQESTINQDIKAYRLFDSSISEYVYYMLKGLETHILENYRKQVTTVDSLKFDEFSKEMLVPLPPLAEQKRIVARLEELLPLCERLK